MVIFWYLLTGDDGIDCNNDDDYDNEDAEERCNGGEEDDDTLRGSYK